MFDTRKIQHDFGRAAAEYDAQAELQRIVRTHVLQLARPFWRAGAHVLDLGCGTGAFAVEAVAARWRITGLDIAYGMCAEASKRLRAVNARAESLPFADAAFDGIFTSLMLQWSDNPRGVYEEMARVLKSGGYAVIATLVQGTLHELKSAFAELDDVPHVNEFAAAHRLLECAEQAGLALAHARQMPLVEHYADVVALMRALQVIGAGNKHVARGRGLMTPRHLARLERIYKMKYDTKQGLQASWQVLFLLLRKV